MPAPITSAEGACRVGFDLPAKHGSRCMQDLSQPAFAAIADPGCGNMDVEYKASCILCSAWMKAWVLHKATASGRACPLHAHVRQVTGSACLWNWVPHQPFLAE